MKRTTEIDAKTPKGQQTAHKPLRRRHRSLPTENEEQKHKRLRAMYWKQSPILNPSAYAINYSALSMSHKEGLRNLLHTYERKGLERNEDRPFGILELAKLEVEGVEKEFEKLKQSAVNSGKIPPDKMPEDLADKYMQARIKLSLKSEERQKIKKLLEKFEQEEQQKAGNHVLYYGPCGGGKGDPLREIDGQTVKQNKGGVLVIDDPRSPYDKMKVVDYRERVIKPFVKQRKGKMRAVRRENLPPRPEGL